MIARPAWKPFALTLGAALVLALALGVAGRAAAAANAPSWSAGDYWRWSWTTGSTSYTQTWTVLERTTLTFTSGSFAVWHLNETTTATTSSSSTTTWDDLWIQDASLGFAQRVFVALGIMNVLTWDPPMVQAVFPLNGNAWSLTTTQTLQIGSLIFPSTVSYSGQAQPETDVAVAVGSFHVVPVRSPATGANYEVKYYAESAGNFVRIDTVQNGQVTESQNLTSYRYQAGGVGLLVLVLGVVVGIAAVTLIAFFVTRRRPRYPARYDTMQPVPPTAPVPPPQAPPGGPPGRPPGT